MSALHRIVSALSLVCIGMLVACRSTDELSGVKTSLFDSPDAYDLEFDGADSLSSGLMQQASAGDLEDFEAGGFRPSQADDAAYSIESFYRARGFPAVAVTFELIVEARAKPLLRFHIVEGPRCVIDDVQFVGNQAFPSKDLASLLGGPTTGLLGLGSLYYVQTEAESARSAIENLYSDNGYIDVRVTLADPTFNAEGDKATLRYEVVEGPRYRIRTVELAELPGHDLTQVRQRLATYPGQNYFPRLIYEMRSAASESFAESGYPDAAATATEVVDQDTGEVDVAIVLVAGDEVRISEIQITGNDDTRENFIRQQLGMQPGDLYRQSAQRRAFKRLYSTGLFKSVSIDLRGKGPERKLHVQVVEAETQSFFTEAGYGAFEGARFLFGISEASLLGSGRALKLEGKIAERAQGAQLTFSDPYTIDFNNVIGMSIFAEERELESFDSQELGTGVNLTHHHTERYSNVYGYEYRISKASDITVSIPGLDSELQDDAYISAIYLTNVYDSRESFFLPRSGTWLRLRTEFAPEALGSELNFVRFDGRIVRYHPLDDSNLFAWTLRSGVIFPIGGTAQIPLQERFYNGGQNSVRSFKEDRLGPKDSNGTPVGGEAYSTFSIEYRRELISSLSGALFVDAGNVSFEHQDALRFADIRYGVGPGLRWMLPVGPLRLDWGINPNPRPDESDWALQFSLGISF